MQAAQFTKEKAGTQEILNTPLLDKVDRMEQMSQEYPIKRTFKIDKKGRNTIPKDIRRKLPFKEAYEIEYVETPGDWFIQIRELKP